MRFIGLCGAKGSGKDTVARFIIEADPRFRRVAFADVMKEMALGIDPYVNCWDGIQNGTVVVNSTYVRLSDLVGNYGWETAKKIAEVRRFLQRLGTEGGRACLGEHVWVKATWDRFVYPVIEATPDDGLDNPTGPNAPSFVFTDVRFPNEIAAIVAQPHGELWRIDRATVEDGDPHPSERAWREFVPDRVIDNAGGSLEELRGHVERFLALPYRRSEH